MRTPGVIPEGTSRAVSPRFARSWASNQGQVQCHRSRPSVAPASREAPTARSVALPDLRQKFRDSLLEHVARATVNRYTALLSGIFRRSLRGGFVEAGQRHGRCRPSDVQALGGWRALALVERYAHLAPDHLQAAVERIVPVAQASAAPAAVETAGGAVE